MAKRGRQKIVITDRMKKIVKDNAGKLLSQPQLAELCGLGLSTFKRNLDIFAPIIKESVENAEINRVKEVESALYKRAMGYNITESKIEDIQIYDNETKSWITDPTKRKQTRTTKHITGSVVAQTFILCNRDRERWQSMHKIEPEVPDSNEPLIIETQSE